MSFLTKAGERFRLDLKRVPKHRLPYFEKLQKATQPGFIRPQLEVDLHADGSVPTDPRKLKYLVGDRVLIVKGPKSGNVCKVSRHVEHGGYILDENGPSTTVVVPKQFWTEGQRSHVVTFPKPVTEDQIRLIAEIEDDVSQKAKTVAVDNIEFKGTYYDEDYKKEMPYRTVYGQSDMVIPWPRPAPVEDGSLSTDVNTVRERSYFVESIVRDDIPSDALDSIRKKHSKWRRGKLTKTEVKRLTPPEMPLTETKKAYLAERELKKQQPKILITDEMKAFLGKRVREHEVKMLQKLEELQNL
jgi:large subunit ribosomal protein L24